MKNIAFIPVRGGSKSIPKKNIKMIAGRPLIYWTVSAANYCEQIDEIYVATDSHEIKDVVESFGFDKVIVVDRSPEVSDDTASTESVMTEFVSRGIEFDNIILIQATSPLLSSYDLESALKLKENSRFDSILSVVRQKRFIWVMEKDGAVAAVNYDYRNRPRRQEFDGFLVENGAFYITSREFFIRSRNRISGKIGCYEMPEESYVELDEPSDWPLVEELILRAIKRDIEKSVDIKLFVSDVDGVLTDAGMYYGENGDEQKKFNTRDGKGFEFLRAKKIKTAIITSEDTDIVKRRSEKIKIDFLYQGAKDKVKILKELCKKENISLSQVAYIGDDLNDLNAIKKCGISACPADAVKKIRYSVDYICSKKGGEGCVREFIELLTDGGGVS